jgi:hypothetical protein
MDHRMGDSKGVRRTAWESLRSTVIAAFCLFIVDAFVFGWFVIAMFASIALVFWMIPRTLLDFIRGNVVMVRELKTGIYLLMVVATFAAYAGNSYLAKSRADTVIAAVDQFKAYHHRYPESLAELVPKYMSSVPRAKYTVMYGEFIFLAEMPRLMYFGFPPFDRRVYSFDSKKWMVLD